MYWMQWSFYACSTNRIALSLCISYNNKFHNDNNAKQLEDSSNQKWLPEWDQQKKQTSANSGSLIEFILFVRGENASTLYRYLKCEFGSPIFSSMDWTLRNKPSIHSNFVYTNVILFNWTLHLQIISCLWFVSSGKESIEFGSTCHNSKARGAHTHSNTDSSPHSLNGVLLGCCCCCFIDTQTT